MLLLSLFLVSLIINSKWKMLLGSVHKLYIKPHLLLSFNIFSFYFT